MRTKIVVAGLVVLVVGTALIAGGASGLLARTATFKTFSQPNTGEFVSGEIVLNTTSVVEVRSPATNAGLVPANDLGEVDSSNVASYATKYNSTAAGTDVYQSLEGSYYYVVFSSSAPSTIVITIAKSSSDRGYGLIALAGVVCLIAGIVLAVVGVVKKGNKKTETISESEYYSKR